MDMGRFMGDISESLKHTCKNFTKTQKNKKFKRRLAVKRSQKSSVLRDLRRMRVNPTLHLSITAREFLIVTSRGVISVINRIDVRDDHLIETCIVQSMKPKEKEACTMIVLIE